MLRSTVRRFSVCPRCCATSHCWCGVLPPMMPRCGRRSSCCRTIVRSSCAVVTTSCEVSATDCTSPTAPRETGRGSALREALLLDLLLAHHRVLVCAQALHFWSSTACRSPAVDRTGTDDSRVDTHSVCGPPAAAPWPRASRRAVVTPSWGSCCDRLQQPRLTDARGTHAKAGFTNRSRPPDTPLNLA